MQPSFVSLVKEPNGKVLLDQKPVTKTVLDPRVDYLVVNMLEEVMRTGTAAGVRARGFTAPAAGKTGTSHDGWFAGFTSDLLCIVWVGFDDNRELDIEGAHSALPIWTEFMKRAVQLRQYADAKPFAAPDGVVTVTIDPESGMPATPQCPTQSPEVFIAGTEPVGTCPLHGGKGDHTTVSGWDTSIPGTPAGNPPPNPRTATADIVGRAPAADGKPPISVNAGYRPESTCGARPQKERLFRQVKGCVQMKTILASIAFLDRSLVRTICPHSASNSPRKQRGDLYMARKMYREAIEHTVPSDRIPPSCGIRSASPTTSWANWKRREKLRARHQTGQEVCRRHQQRGHHFLCARRNTARAISRYKKALTISPDSASIWSNLGTA